MSTVKNITYTKSKKQQSLRINAVVIILFLFISFLDAFLLLRTGKIQGYSDFFFHSFRVQEIFDNLSTGHFTTAIASHTFGKTGVANFLFYPSVFLYPWAFFKVFLPPVTAFYVWYGLITFICLVVSYASMWMYSKDHVRSFIFALIYTLVPYRLYLGTAVFGEFIAYSFLPLFFYGVYSILWRNSKSRSGWIIAAVGISLICYSHILSVFICAEYTVVLVVIYLIQHRGKVDKKIVLDALKSLCLALILCLFILIPFVTDFKNIVLPYSGIWVKSLVGVKQLINTSVTNFVSSQSIGILLLATLFVAWVPLISKKSNDFDLIVFSLAVVSLIMTTKLFPWFIMSNTIMGKVQLAWRYLPYASLFLSVLCSEVARFFNFSTKQIMSLMLSLSFFSFLAFAGMTNNYRTNLSNGTIPTLKTSNPKKFTKLSNPVILNNKNYHNIFEYGATYGEFDYYPSQAMNGATIKSSSVLNHDVVINGKHLIHTTPYSGANELAYRIKVNSLSRVDIPVLSYNHTRLYDNGNEKDFSISPRGTVQTRLSKGVHHLSVRFVLPPIYYVSILITITGWITLIFLVIKRRMNSRE